MRNGGSFPRVATRRDEAPERRNVLIDTAALLGTRQVEPSPAVLLAAHDGCSALAAEAAELERAKSPISSSSSSIISSSSLGAFPGSPTAPGRVQDVAAARSQPTEPPGGGGRLLCQSFCARGAGSQTLSQLLGRPFFPAVWAKLWQTSPGTNLCARVWLSPSVPPAGLQLGCLEAESPSVQRGGSLGEIIAWQKTAAKGRS